MAERGRPREYQDAVAFAEKVSAYFDDCIDSEKRPTLSGLSYWLGFEDRETFSSYANEGPDFARTVKRAKLQIADWLEQRLTDKNTFTPGIIFDLKNNHGWKDKTEQELTGAEGGPVQVAWLRPE
jgi:hypothetical protein